MKYLSKIALCLNEEAYHQFHNVISGCPNEFELLSIFHHADDVYCFKKSHLYYWKQIDWKGLLPNYIVWILLNVLNPCQFLFIRIGKDPNDIEQYGGYFNNPFGLELNINFHSKNDD